MDKRTVPNIEQRNNKSDPVASGSRSFVTINSIAIELNSPVEAMERPAVHEQFSIRGFVSEMRRRDINKCYPFGERFGGGNLEDSLPDLAVPRFQWWETLVPERSGAEAVVAAGGEDVGTDNVGPSSMEIVENQIHSRDSEDGNHHDQGNASQKCGTETQRETIFIKDKTGPGTPRVDATNANPLRSSTGDVNSPFQKYKTGPRTPRVEATNANVVQRSTRDDNTPEASDIAPLAEPHPSAQNVSPASEGASHKRAEKLRSLEDIIREDRKQRSVNRRNKSASSSRVQTTPAEIERDVSIPQRVDVPSNVSKGPKLPPTKRKASHEDPALNCPSSSAKRSKGQLLEVERTWRRVENAVTESSRDAHAPQSSQLGANSLLTQFQLSKQARPAETENGNVTVRERQQVNPNCSADFRKRDASPKNNSTKQRSIPAGRMPPPFSRSLSEQHVEKVPSMNRKRAEIEAFHRPSIPSGNITLGNSSKGKAPLELSLSNFPPEGTNPTSLRQDRDIPDLNLSIALNTTVMQGKHLATLSNSGLPLSKNLETSASSSRAVIDGKGAVSEQQPCSKTDQQATEEYPREVVDLLAEKQRERELENSRGAFNEEFIRGSYARQTEAPRALASFGFSERIGQSIPISFSPHPPRNQFGVSSWNEGQFRLFGPFGQTQQNLSQQRRTGYAALTPVTSGPGPSGVSDLLWPPTRPNMPQNLAFSSSPYSGKTVSDIRCREEKRGLNWSSQTSAGGFNPHPKETCIPAMTLLSLMDQRGGSSVKIGQPTNAPNKSLAASSSHPRVLGNENPNFVNGFYISPNGQSKDFFGLRYGASSVNEKNASQFTRPLPPQQRNSRGIHLDGPRNLAVQPAASMLPLGPCTLNRNPADFSIPDATNPYTRTAAAVNFRKKNNGRERPRSLKPAGQKRQRARHDPPSKQK